MHKENQDIKALADSKHIRMWMVADCFGMSEGSFCKKLRYPLSDSDREKIIRIINDLSFTEV